MKQCNKCLEEKPYSEFSRERETKDGYRNQCKACRDIYRTEHRAKNREVWNAYMREYRKEHSGSVEWKAKSRNRMFKHRYGITTEERDQMLKYQDGKCAICGKTEQQAKGTLHVDHCHSKKTVRGLLCGHCNYFLGYISEDLDVIAMMTTYIKKHS